MQFTTLADVRAFVHDLAKRSPQNFGWLSELPSRSLDEQAYAWINDITTGPASTILKCNPFAVEQQLSDIAGLYDRARVLRIESHSVEAALIREVLSDDFDSRSEAERMSLDEMAYRADTKAAGSPNADPPLVSNPVQPLYDKGREFRQQKRVFRRSPGHPFNLLERLSLLRIDYCKTISRLIAKAEAVRLVLLGSFGYATQSIIRTYPSSGNPLIIIEEWLRDLAVGLEHHANTERVVTIYRLLESERWWTAVAGQQSLADQLKQHGPIRIDVRLDPANFGLGNSEVARVLAIGVMPVFGSTGLKDSNAEVASEAALVAELRAYRQQLSFDASISFPSQSYPAGISGTVSETQYTYPGFTEHFSGIRAWGMSDGSAANALWMQSSPRLTNRPIPSSILISLENEVRANWGMFDRPGIPRITRESELTPFDLLLGIRIAIRS